MARGTVNTPAKKVKTDLESLGAQAKLKGQPGQFVGFDEQGNAVPANAPGTAAHAASHKTGGSDELKPADIGAQAALKGTKGQIVGFNEAGEAVPQEAPSGAGAHAASHKTGGSDELKPADIGAQAALKGTAGQYVGFDEEGNAVPVEAPESSGGASAFFGTIGTDWTEDENTGVKSQLVAIEGVLAAHQSACLDVIMTHERTTEGYALFVEEKNQFLQYITNGDAETVDGGVMFYIYGEPNTIEIPFALEVV